MSPREPAEIPCQQHLVTKLFLRTIKTLCPIARIFKHNIRTNLVFIRVSGQSAYKIQKPRSAPTLKSLSARAMPPDVLLFGGTLFESPRFYRHV